MISESPEWAKAVKKQQQPIAKGVQKAVQQKSSTFQRQTESTVSASMFSSKNYLSIKQTTTKTISKPVGPLIGKELVHSRSIIGVPQQSSTLTVAPASLPDDT